MFIASKYDSYFRVSLFRYMFFICTFKDGEGSPVNSRIRVYYAIGLLWIFFSIFCSCAPVPLNLEICGGI